MRRLIVSANSVIYVGPDRLSIDVPFVGELEGKPGSFICAGHNGHGEFTTNWDHQ